jgi:hypothetical protein
MPIVAFVIHSKRRLYRSVATKIKSLVRLEDQHACENSPLFKLNGFFQQPRKLQYRAESYFLGHEFTPERMSGLRKGIREVFDPYDLRPLTSDTKVGADVLFERICVLIAESAFCIFDLPNNKNPNVYLELGIAIGMQRPLLLTKYAGATPTPLISSLYYIGFEKFTGVGDGLPGGAEWEIGRAVHIKEEMNPEESSGVCVIYTGEDGPNTYRDGLKDAICSACKKSGLPAILDLGWRSEPGPMLYQTIARIQEASVAVFNIDKTMPDDNFLALGIALSLGKKCILICKSDKEVPSDLNGSGCLLFKDKEELELVV